MLSNLLERLEYLKNNNNFNLSENQILELENLIQFYDGGILPISAVRRILNLEISKAHDLMIFLESIGVLKTMFKIHCPQKSEIIREEVYDDIRKIPKKYCDKCSEGCKYIENVIVVFKVV